MPKISVIVPVYNDEKWLTQSLDSILCQTFTDFEVIIVDDGSTDRSPQICDTYAQAQSRVHVFHQPNQGSSAARNKALAEARGEWIVLVDSDDWINPDSFRLLMNKADESGVDLIAFDFLFEYPETRKSVRYSRGEADCLMKSAEELRNCHIRVLAPEWFHQGSYHGTMWDGLGCARCFKREHFQKEMFHTPEVQQMEDNLISLRFLDKTEGLAYLHAPLYHYRRNPVSVTRNYTPRSLDRLMPFLKKLREYVRLNFPNDQLFEQAYDARIINGVEIILRNNYCHPGNKHSFRTKIREMRKIFSGEPFHLAIENFDPACCNFSRKISIFLMRRGCWGLVWCMFRLMIAVKGRSRR